MQELWDEVNTLLSVHPEDVSIEVVEKYEQLCHEWGLKSLDLYHKKEVTPYIHAMSGNSCAYMNASFIYAAWAGEVRYNDI